MALIRCPKCGEGFSDDCVVVWKCSECGKTLETDMSRIYKIKEQRHKIVGKNLLKCADCGHVLDDGNEEIICKCSTCGNIIGGNLEYFVGETFLPKQSTEYLCSSIIKCPECGKEIKDTESKCSGCGYSLVKLEKKEDADNEPRTESFRPAKKSHTESFRSIRTMVITFAVICFVVSGAFFAKGYNVKNEYYNSDYSSLNKNAYVGGDAYNYIINGTYFTGYSVIASAMLVCGMILISNSIMITLKMKEYEQ